jgi:hypothetical protein
MNALRRWIDRKPWRAAFLGFLQPYLISVNLLLFAYTFFFGWWNGVAAIVLVPVNVWLFLAASTNWRWDGG